MITVISGANSESFPFQGRTVGAVRSALSGLYGIAADAVATVNGAAADEDLVLAEGAELSFSRRTAQKG